MCGTHSLTNRRLKRGVFCSVAELEAAIDRFLAETNANPTPFVWTVRPKRILAAVKRGKEKSESIHWGMSSSGIPRRVGTDAQREHVIERVFVVGRVISTGGNLVVAGHAAGFDPVRQPSLHAR